MVIRAAYITESEFQYALKDDTFELTFPNEPDKADHVVWNRFGTKKIAKRVF